jgi:virginiamycin B lyase
VTGAGGTTGLGGSRATGGAGAGGKAGTGGTIGAGGTIGTGGTIGAGGTIGTGGTIGAGGTIGTGGLVGSGGSGSGGTVLTPAHLTLASAVGGASGGVVIGDSATVSYVVTNTGQQPSSTITVSLTGNTTAFRLILAGSPPCSNGVTVLGGGEVCYVQVQFQPITVGTVTATLAATMTGSTATAMLTLPGNGLAAPSGSMHDFGLPGFANAFDVAPGGDGNIWFADYDNNRVGRMTLNGSVTYFPVPTATAGPGRITQGPDGNVWFTETLASRIGVITPTGTITEYPCPTAGSSPFGITTGPDGNLWFADAAEKIGRITPKGVITEFTATGVLARGITVGTDHNLWFSDANGNIGRITTAGVITKFPVPSPNLEPTAVAADSGGNIWYTNNGVANNASVVGRMTTAGVATEFPVDWQSATDSIVLGPDGNMWFTIFTNEVVRMTPNGTRTTFTTIVADPAGITVGPDGNIYVADGMYITRIAP